MKGAWRTWLGKAKRFSLSHWSQNVSTRISSAGPILGPLRLLPLVRHLQQLRYLRSGFVIRREDVIIVFLHLIIIQLSSLLDLPWHLFLNLLDVFRRAMCVFERLPSI